MNNITILIVDDEHRNTFALSSYLETMDIRTIAAENGEIALKLLKSGIYTDLILLDMMMPVMDGYETLAALKSDESMKQIPVIALTARAMKGDKEKCIDAGAWDYLSKPVNTMELMDTIKKWLGKNKDE